MIPDARPQRWYDFFAGGGMAHAGLGDSWECTFAVDNDPRKTSAYALNWGDEALHVQDVRDISIDQLPGYADLAWASWPCQDLSIAGLAGGLAGERSGMFWAFWRIINQLAAVGRAPSVVVLENVTGALTASGGADFTALCEAIRAGGYHYGALVVDATRFVPQSRPRLFIVAARDDRADIPSHLVSADPESPWHTRAVRAAHQRLSTDERAAWVWWHLPEPEPRRDSLAALVQEAPSDVPWHTPDETAMLLGQMNQGHLDKVAEARRRGHPMVGTVYRRTRRDEQGQSAVRAEVRFDGVAGCLRTPAGGSSRQIILCVDGSRTRSRLISGREAARLMGLPDDYILPKRYTDTLRLMGDGLVAPVVRYLASNLIEPLVRARVHSGRPEQIPESGTLPLL